MTMDSEHLQTIRECVLFVCIAVVACFLINACYQATKDSKDVEIAKLEVEKERAKNGFVLLPQGSCGKVVTGPELLK